MIGSANSAKHCLVVSRALQGLRFGSMTSFLRCVPVLEERFDGELSTRLIRLCAVKDFSRRMAILLFILCRGWRFAVVVFDVVVKIGLLEAEKTL